MEVKNNSAYSLSQGILSKPYRLHKNDCTPIIFCIQPMSQSVGLKVWIHVRFRAWLQSTKSMHSFNTVWATSRVRVLHTLKKPHQICINQQFHFVKPDALNKAIFEKKFIKTSCLLLARLLSPKCAAHTHTRRIEDIEDNKVYISLDFPLYM